MGINGALSEAEAGGLLEEALTQPLQGDWEALRRAILQAERILYIAAHAGVELGALVVLRSLMVSIYSSQQMRSKCEISNRLQ